MAGGLRRGLEGGRVREVAVLSFVGDQIDGAHCVREHAVRTVDTVREGMDNP